MFSSIFSPVPCTAYQDSAVTLPALKSTDSILTSASCSSLCTPTSQGSSLDPCSADEFPMNDPPAPSKGRAFSRTPLSTKAKPFISSADPWKTQQVPAFNAQCQGDAAPAFTSSARPSHEVSTAASTAASSLEGSGMEMTDAPSQENLLRAARRAHAFAQSLAQAQAYAKLQMQQQAEKMDVYWQPCIPEETSYNEALQEAVYLQTDQTSFDKEKPANHDMATEAKTSSSSSSPPTSGKQKSTPTETPCLPIRSLFFPVKHTFVHYSDNNEAEESWETVPMFSTSQSSRARSAPKVLTPNDFEGLPFSKEMAKVHLLDNCHPCAYHHNKKDGCRWGEDCKFCHLCPPDELKKRKKLKIKAIKGKLANLEESTKNAVTTSDGDGLDDGELSD